MVLNDTHPLPQDPVVRRVVEALTDGVVVLDGGFRIAWMNDAAERLVQHHDGALVGRRLWQALPQLRCAPLISACQSSLQQGTPTSAEFRIDTADLWLEARVFPASGGGLLLTFRDISEHMRSQSECDRLLEAEALARAAAERAAQRLGVLQSLTARLAETVTLDDVMNVVVGVTLKAIGADGAMVAISTPSSRLQVIAFTGLEKQIGEPDRFIPLDAELPLAAAFRNKKPEWIETGEELAARYPKLRADIEPLGFSGATAALPLCVSGRTLGSLLLWFNAARAFPPEDRALLEAIADQCAIALDRAQTFTREHRMLEEARASEQRSRFLAEASGMLAASLDYRLTLNSVARMAVPQLADWCVVHMVQPTGSLERLVVTHSDPAKVELAAELAQRYPVNMKAEAGLPRVIRTGVGEWVREVPRAAVDVLAPTPEDRAMLARLGLRSYLCVPIKSRGVVRGAITLFQAESGRLYDENDFRLAQDLAQQASMAVDNALLYREAQDAISLRDDFLSVASHELKTPLTPLHLRLQSIVRDAPQDARTRQHVEVAQRQIRKLATLVDGLLDVTRISAGRLQLDLEDVDLAALAREVASRSEPEAARAGSHIQVEADGPVVGRWDRLRLDQVITNLVSNAIKYGAGKPIGIRVALDDAQARLEVSDGGIGIAAADMKRIFERFERAVSGRNYGGLGLGLYITRLIVDALGASIAVESALAQGSTFTVRLPLLRN